MWKVSFAESHLCRKFCVGPVFSAKSERRRTVRPGHKAAILPLATKKALFYHAKPHPHGFIARLSVVKQSFFGLPGQYGRRVTRVN